MRDLPSTGFYCCKDVRLELGLCPMRVECLALQFFIQEEGLV